MKNPIITAPKLYLGAGAGAVIGFVVLSNSGARRLILRLQSWELPVPNQLLATARKVPVRALPAVRSDP